MKIIRLALVTCWGALVTLAFVTTVNAQVCDTVSLCQETLSSDFFGVDARAMSMGNTGIALAHDGSAMIYNPANLARVKRIEARVGISHLRTKNDTRLYFDNDPLADGNDLNKTRINALSITAPVPTYRGSLVFGFGLHRVNSFDRAFGILIDQAGGPASPSDGAMELETGGLWKWTASGAMDISPRLSVGLSVHLLTGEDEYRYKRVDDRSTNRLTEEQSIDIKYVGVGATGGLSYAASPYVTVGLVVETPTFLAAEENAVLIFDTLFSDYFWEHPTYADYNITKPFVFGLGAAASVEHLNVVGDLRYTDWSQLDIEYDDPGLASDEAAALSFINSTLREIVSIHLGAEYIFPASGISARAGFFYDPLPVASQYIESNRQYFTLGAGFLIDRIMTLDVAYVDGGYELRDANPGTYFAKYKTRRAFVTFGYRI